MQLHVMNSASLLWASKYLIHIRAVVVEHQAVPVHVVHVHLVTLRVARKCVGPACRTAPPCAPCKHANHCDPVLSW